MSVKKDIGLYIILVIGITVAIAFLIASANTITGSTQKVVVTDEIINIAPARLADGAINNTYVFTPAHTSSNTGWRANSPECTVSTITIKNNSNVALTTPTDYVYTSGTGTFVLEDTAPLNGQISNNTKVSYSYCGDNYVPGSSNQSILTLIILFGAIAILVWVIVTLIKNGGLYNVTSKVREMVGA